MATDLLNLDLGLDDILSTSGVPRRRRSQAPVLSPELEESLLSRVGRTSLGGVAAVGNVLDLPGSMVRDALSLSNPFDQLLSPFSDENRTTGRDMLRNIGLAGKKDTWGNWAAGMAVETLLDPTTYLTFGGSALTKAGKVAQAASLLDDVTKATARGVGSRVGKMTTTLDDLIAAAGGDAAERAAEAASKMGVDLAEIGSQKLGTIARAELPFTGMGFNFGTDQSKLAMKLAGGLDAAGLALNKTLPIRLARAAFDPSVGGKLDYFEQQVAKEAYKLSTDAQRAARKARADVLDTIEEGFSAFDGSMGEFLNQRSVQAFDSFKQQLASAGNLNVDEADTVAKLWKSWSEGYLGEDFAASMQKRFAGITRDGAVPNNALAQRAPEFYSKLARVVEAKMPNATTWDQLKATLKNNGVKDEEIRDMGLEAAFGGKKLTKQQVMDTIAENAVTVETKVQGGYPPHVQNLIDQKEAIDNQITRLFSQADTFELEQQSSFLDDQIKQLTGNVSPEFESYSIPGGSKYKEILLKSPLKSTSDQLYDQANALWHEADRKYGNDWMAKDPEGYAKYLKLQRQAESIEGVPQNYKGPHWKDRNVIAHIRADDVTLPDGNKMLRIQEIQSDWHQAGKKLGYGSPTAFSDGGALAQMGRVSTKIADGPFKDSWRQLAVKKVLRYAAENGYDSVGLVDGADIAEAIGGPASELRTFYNDILAGDFKKLTKKGYVGEVEVDIPADMKRSPVTPGTATPVTGGTLADEIDWTDLEQAQQLPDIVDTQVDDMTTKSQKWYTGRTQVFQLSDEVRKTILEEGQPLYQKAQGAVKGAVDFSRDGKAMLYTFRETDVSTHIHELGHVMRRHLTPEDSKIANSFVGAKEGAKWTVDQEEKFARGFERYLREGKAPNSVVGEMFAKLKEWMTSIYQSIAGTDIDVKLSPEIKQLYSKLVGTQPRLPQSQLRSFDTFTKLIRLTGELDGDVQRAMSILDGSAPDVADDVAQNVREIARSMRTVMDDVHGSIQSKGGKRGTILDREAAEGLAPYSFAPRYANFESKSGKASRQLKLRDGSSQARNAALQTLPAEIANRIGTDASAKAEDGATYIKQTFGEFLDPNFADGAGVDEHAKALAEWAAKQGDEPLFTNSYPEDFFKYVKGGYTVDASLDAVHEVIRQNLDVPAESAVSIKRAFANAGMNTEKAMEHLSTITGKSVDELANSSIPTEVANAIVSSQKIFERPEWMNEVGKQIDTFNSWFKQSVTMPFPSFWFRNFTSGQYVNLAMGLVENPQDMARYSKHLIDTSKMMATGVDPKLMRELEIEGVIDTRYMGQGVESLGHGFTPTGPSNPARLNQTWAEAGQRIAENPSIVDRLPGSRAARQVWGTIVGTGEKASAGVEFANRVPLYLYLKEKGWSPKAAAAKVREMHVDYDDLAPFEKETMRRLVPFFTFQRKIAPVLMTTLMERPGGALAQTIRLNNSLRGETALTPDYVANGMSVPLGEQPDGSDRYITGLGLPYEQTFQFFDGGVQGLLRESLSQTTPIVKAPLEWATGQSFFQEGPGGAGRALEELDPTIGRTLANLTREPGSDPVPLPTAFEFLFANSPLARVASTARQVTDTRKDWDTKAWNLLTGARITDVPVQAQEGIFRDRANEMMRDLGASAYENVYFNDRDMAALSDEQKLQAEELELLRRVLANRAKKRAKDK